MPPKHLQRVLLDSIDPTVFAELIKSINPEITPNNTRLTLIPDAELSNKLFYFASKSRIYQSKPLQLATGILTLNHDDKHLSTIYSIATLSNEDSAVSILIGYGFEGKKIGGGTSCHFRRSETFRTEILFSWRDSNGWRRGFFSSTRHQTLFRGWAFCLGVYLPLFNKLFI